MPRWKNSEVTRNREQAIANGDETYQGYACKYGHPGIRMTKYRGKCLYCHEGFSRLALAGQYKKAERAMLSGAKSRARQNNRDFDLILEDIIIPERCPISLEPFEPCSQNAPTLDRIDSHKGYTRDNIMVISKRVNTSKRGFTISQLERLLEYMRVAELLR